MQLQPANKLRYLIQPYPDDVVEMISYLPKGFQALACQQNCVSLNFVVCMARATSWGVLIRSNLTPSPELKELQSDGPIYDMRGVLWDILRQLDPLSAPLERLLCMTHYVQMGSMYYRNLVQTTSIFQDLRAEATDIIYRYTPQTTAERDALIYHSTLIIDSWKVQGVLQLEGFSLLRSLRYHYPDVRQWDALKIILQRFLWVPPALAEWKDNLRLLDSRKD